MTTGLTRDGFEADKKSVGEPAEREFRAWLTQKRYYEVKNDIKAAGTGKVFIEFWQPSGPSGISVTTADAWAIKIGDDTWLLVTTERLKELHYRARKNGQMVLGGDFDKFSGTPIPIRWFMERRG